MLCDYVYQSLEFLEMSVYGSLNDVGNLKRNQYNSQFWTLILKFIKWTNTKFTSAI